jgi:predicted dehydrogenase
MRLGFVGCGNIAERYAKTVAAAPGLELVAATDLLPGRADAFVAKHGGTSYATLSDLLAADEVDTVVNLTDPQVHAEVTAAALDGGRHVHTEKPLALRYDEARELVELASSRGLGLSCAPATLLGEAQQTAWKLLRDGAIGRVRAAYAEANWGKIERWHPSPEAILRVGPLVDVGIYPLTVVTAMFGPARSVTAYATMLEPERVRRDGVSFRLETPDFIVAAVELADGTVARVTASFYVGPSKQRGLELHGDDGLLYLASWAEFDSRLEVAGRDGEYAPAPLLREPYPGTDWSRALSDLAEALEDGRPPRAGAAHAAHVVEILAAAEKSYRDGGAVEVTSDFPQPQPVEWAL